LTSFEIKFFRRTAGCTRFDHRENGKMLEDLKAEPVDEKLRRYKSDWLWHITKMNSSRMPKIMLNCRPHERRHGGRPLKRLLDEAETGLSRPNTWRMMMMMMMMMMICCRWWSEVDCSPWQYFALVLHTVTLWYIIEEKMAVKIRARPMFLTSRVSVVLERLLFYFVFYSISLLHSELTGTFV
jgi:hypothetical protein